MMANTKLAILRLLLVGTLLSASANGSQAAELRTTVAGKPVHRTASFEISDKGTAPLLIEPPLAVGCDSCGGAGCGMSCVQTCGRWAKFDYLMWWRSGNGLPALATTSPNGTPLAQAGLLGAAGTTVIFGNDTYGEDASPGGRVRFGSWLDGCHCNAWEGRFFALGQQTVDFNITSNGDPILVRPFNNRDALLGALGPVGRPIAFPGIATNGVITVRGESEIYGGDVIMRHRFRDNGCVQLDVLGGYQYSAIDESLVISDSFVDSNPANLVPDGTQQQIVDSFATENEFHGGLIGLEASYQRDCWRLDLLARIAFGTMKQRVAIMGQTTNTVPNAGGPVTIAGGLLANAGNQGTRERDEFAVVPELGATLVFQMTECIDLSLGYSFIYWSNVAQPGDFIDPDLFVPSRSAFNDSSYWVHGFNVGAAFQF